MKSPLVVLAIMTDTSTYTHDDSTDDDVDAHEKRQPRRKRLRLGT